MKESLLFFEVSLHKSLRGNSENVFSFNTLSEFLLIIAFLSIKNKKGERKKRGLSPNKLSLSTIQLFTFLWHFF